MEKRRISPDGDRGRAAVAAGCASAQRGLLLVGERAGAEPWRRRALWMATALALTLVPVGVNVVRAPSYSASIALYPSDFAPPTARARLTLVRDILSDGTLRVAARRELGVPEHGEFPRVRIRSSRGRASGGRVVDVLRLTASASTPRRTKQVADFVAVSVINASARRIALNARSRRGSLAKQLRSPGLTTAARARLQRRRAALAPLIFSGAPSFVLGSRAPQPKLKRAADRLVNRLPGGLPPRRNPLAAGAAGLLLAVLLWLIGLLVPRLAPRAEEAGPDR